MNTGEKEPSLKTNIVIRPAVLSSDEQIALIRNDLECSFGILKKRFLILKTENDNKEK